MPRSGGVYSLPPGSLVTNGDTSDASDLNTPLSDLETDMNTARPIVAGGTGATSASSARTNLGVGTGDSPTFAGMTISTGPVIITGNVGFSASAAVEAQSTVAGVFYTDNGVLGVARNAAAPFAANRIGDDGPVIAIQQDGVNEGLISVSGTTVTYGGATLTHWCRLAGNVRAEILRGTVIEATGEPVEWPGEGDEKHVMGKVSDTPESRAVYGLFVAWENDDAFNDFNVAAGGTFVVRMRAGETPSLGDFVVSAGDGTAKVQADDVRRAATIGKLISTEPRETYPDGSFLLPLMF